ncbi:MAG: glycosyl hydrolase family 32 [Ruminococcaceae bacterium]|nr:glycosyl hydrolase family 32 [Oscillospiraceae bacterium]
MRVFADDFFKIYDPSEGEDKVWYINDHTIIKASDGWHLFGITHEEPAKPLEEILCGHAVTDNLLSVPFSKAAVPFSAEREQGELHFWAPHIIKYNDLYYMFYCAGSLEGHDKYRIHLATSKNLKDWTRHKDNPLLIDGFDARDPMILRVGDEWVMYYTCNSTPQGGNYCVACVTSRDLVHWGEKKVVFTSHLSGTFAGPCESPFVEKVGDWYFLFIGPYGGYGASYCDTAVYASRDPFAFSGDPVGRIPSHASEVVKIEDNYYITHCGWGQGGVFLAPLHFELD